MLECRTNWRIYIEELAFALARVSGREAAWAAFSPESPLTPFERKYQSSGHTLYRLQFSG